MLLKGALSESLGSAIVSLIASQHHSEFSQLRRLELHHTSLEIIAIEMFEPLHITMRLSRSDTVKTPRSLCVLFLLSLVDSFSAVRSFHVHVRYAEVKKRQKKEQSDAPPPNVAVRKATKHFILVLR